MTMSKGEAEKRILQILGENRGQLTQAQLFSRFSDIVTLLEAKHSLIAEGKIREEPFGEGSIMIHLLE